MDTTTFNAFRKIVYDKAGISINDNKVALVAARVGKRLRELGMESDKQYLDYVLSDSDGEELVHLLDVISTNVTSFFREEKHFQFFSTVLDNWQSNGQRKFRVWCAAASSGEEPYTIAMTMLDRLNSPEVNIRILATDISTRVLATCKNGTYPEAKMEPIPDTFRSRFFEKKNTDTGCRYSVRPEVRKIMNFSRLNLATPPFPMNGPLDAIFCRNVMIYFDNIVRKRLLAELHRLVKVGGYLFVGHAESLTGLLSGFKPVMPSVYIKE